MSATTGSVERLRLSSTALARRLPAAGTRGETHVRMPGSVQPGGMDDGFRERGADSDTGFAWIRTDEEELLILPPFPFGADGSFSRIETGTLLEAVDLACTYGVFLLRLGGAAVGVFRNDELIASKVDRRFVKNRHKKGGQSQHRFERTREKQVHELFKKACGMLEDRLGPLERDLDHVFIGGDRRTLQAFRKDCGYLDRFGTRLRARVLPVAGDPRQETLVQVPREVRSSDVYVLHRKAAATDRGEPGDEVLDASADRGSWWTGPKNHPSLHASGDCPGR